MARLRVIPATMMAAFLLLGVKVIDVVRGTEALSNQILIAPVEAEESGAKKPEAAAKPAEKPAAKPAEKAAAKAEESKKGEAKPEAKGEAKEGKSDAKGEGKEDAKPECTPEKPDPKKNPAVSEEPGDIVDHRFTAVEIELLQNLVKRREELDRWEKNIQVKEEVLNIAQKRIDDKAAQIDAMKKEVGGLLAKYNDIEDAKIKSLVKIYESMKPKDAARIFEEIEMPVLMLVIDKMSEKKTAPILAEMTPKKAKQITVELAEERRVNSARLGNAAAATAPAATPAAAPAPAPAK